MRYVLALAILGACGAPQGSGDRGHHNPCRGGLSTNYNFTENIRKLCVRPEDLNTAAEQYSFIGRYFSAHKAFDQLMGETGPQDIYFDTSDFRAHSAIEYIVEKARGSQIVIINEAHHVPYHRFFTMLLLAKLHESGFTFFGAETLSHSDTVLNNRGYPTLRSGYYTREPQYGNLIRQAIKTGFYVFAYEARGGVDGKLREIEQARNIARVLEVNPKAKILIHCGFGHLIEGKVEGWEKAMAGRVLECTGIDPLTIDQVELSEHSDKKFENPYYRKLNYKYFKVIRNSSVTIPVNFRIGGKSSDIFVYHPRTKLLYNRPDWLFQFYKPKFLVNDIKISFPVIIKAYLAQENDEIAIPIDVIEVEKKADSTALALMPGNWYTIVVENQNKQKQILKLKF
ncbi:MAG: hypothetical protein PSX36_08225 [bacterium]|nr:hypothetical protein [bacterium]